MQPDQNDDYIKQLFSIIEDKFDTIIKLLTEINSKLGQTQPNTNTTSKPHRVKKLTEEQKLHQAALDAIERDRPRRQKRAEKMFAKEWAELDEKKKELQRLKDELAKRNGTQ